MGEREALFPAVMDFEPFIQADDERERWNRHRNEPWCVVGEHKHWPPDPFGDGASAVLPLLGELVDTLILLLPFPWDAMFISNELRREKKRVIWATRNSTVLQILIGKASFM